MKIELEQVVNLLWLSAWVLLLGLAGVVMVMVIRVALRLRWRGLFDRATSKPHRTSKRRRDPWKASADRLIVPMPHPNDKDEPDHGGDDDDR